MSEDADALVVRYGLQPHPEGGFFKETYRAPTSFARAGDGATRSLATSIYYLISTGERSCLHRIRSDEMWFHHAGDALSVYELLPGAAPGAEAAVRRTLVGAEAPAEHFHVAPAGVYFGALLEEQPAAAGAGQQRHGFALVSCVVSPGFDFADWQMHGAEALRAEFPGSAAASVIARLAKD